MANVNNSHLKEKRIDAFWKISLLNYLKTSLFKKLLTFWILKFSDNKQKSAFSFLPTRTFKVQSKVITWNSKTPRIESQEFRSSKDFLFPEKITVQRFFSWRTTSIRKLLKYPKIPQVPIERFSEVSAYSEIEKTYSKIITEISTAIQKSSKKISKVFQSIQRLFYQKNLNSSNTKKN